MKCRIPRLLTTAALVTLLAFPVSVASAKSEGFNDEYVFATTRSLDDAEMNPALKVTLFPVTVVLDTVFLPFAVIAGFVV